MARLWRASVMLAMLLLSISVQAHHDESEPSDGTVNSFIPINPPLTINSVDFVRGASEAVSLDDFKGKLVLLNFWATWCPPCLRELPSLDRLQQRLGSERFEVVAVALDRSGYEGAKAYYQRLGVEHLELYTGSKLAFSYEFPVDVFPSSFFIDSQGRVLSFLRSYVEWDDPAADRMIREYLANSSLSRAKAENPVAPSE
ncbi:TlpA family protein disulfide reductase [Motiliproteus coralliicola]|uniref:TlpA family protein disulfide reductase n=1 Tax=Motiliproteus coralliicola TaxID=2283196 RepID=A0A369WSX0_9GAMM|nr:TlpA disulfide reductase family protein [Motiliproteus coralliicola]RDE22585.1 TlpA family protein disulfide reductase [Motiliproteus coralliicola]